MWLDVRPNKTLGRGFVLPHWAHGCLPLVHLPAWLRWSLLPPMSWQKLALDFNDHSLRNTLVYPPNHNDISKHTRRSQYLYSAFAVRPKIPLQLKPIKLWRGCSNKAVQGILSRSLNALYDTLRGTIFAGGVELFSDRLPPFPLSILVAHPTRRITLCFSR